MNTKVDVNVYDNIIPEDFRKEIWDYIRNQEWYAAWKSNHEHITYYTPAEQKNFMAPDYKSMSLRLPTMWMHRTQFASDDHTLQRDHPTIWKLWNMINQHLGNQYTISGVPEGMAGEKQSPATLDPTLQQGWRVYTNGQPDESIKRSHGVHRDTTDVNDTTTRTILYVANLEWYPSWFGEVIFYPDDRDNITGDHQQFQRDFGQCRGFNIGWMDQGKIVSPVPGRIIDYDGRTLHTTRPAAIWSQDMRITMAFRARKVNQS